MWLADQNMILQDYDLSRFNPKGEIIIMTQSDTAYDLSGF